MPADTVLTPANVVSLTSLTVDSNRISDLTGLKPALMPNLTTLNLVPDDFSVQPERLVSLASLAGLTNLKSLTLQHCGLTDAALCHAATARGRGDTRRSQQRPHRGSRGGGQSARAQSALRTRQFVTHRQPAERPCRTQGKAGRRGCGGRSSRCRQNGQ